MDYPSWSKLQKRGHTFQLSDCQPTPCRSIYQRNIGQRDGEPFIFHGRHESALRANRLKFSHQELLLHGFLSLSLSLSSRASRRSTIKFPSLPATSWLSPSTNLLFLPLLFFQEFSLRSTVGYWSISDRLERLYTPLRVCIIYVIYIYSDDE